MKSANQEYTRFAGEALVQPGIVAIQWLGVPRSTLNRWADQEADVPKACPVQKLGGGFTPVWMASQEQEWKDWVNEHYNRRKKPDVLL